jgi:hypothetical protein
MELIPLVIMLVAALAAVHHHHDHADETPRVERLPAPQERALRPKHYNMVCEAGRYEMVGWPAELRVTSSS